MNEYNGSKAHKENLEKARQSSQKKVECKFCGSFYVLGGIKNHEKSCIKNETYISSLRRNCLNCRKEFIAPSSNKNKKVCSYACSNSYYRKGVVRLNSITSYRKICFMNHEKSCIICNENKIVSVHHLNENHEDNRPENLIPLCPTHHHYVHSKYKYLVQEKIDKYIEQFNISH